MGQPLRPDVMVRQVDAIAGDLPALVDAAGAQVGAALPAAVDRVFLVGDGDSYHAARACEMAYGLADVDCVPVSALPFLGYCADRIRDRTVVVAISSSGETPRVLQAAGLAKERGAWTVALTSTPDSALTRVADGSIVLDLPGREPSPGIRTYQASLVGLLLIALRLAPADPGRTVATVADVRALSGPLAATAAAARDAGRALAAELAGAPTLAFLGSGPNHGTAMFCAAKVIEACGVPAIAQDIEEWWHVERFAAPYDMPLVVVSPPGRTHWRAVEVAARAAALGRRVIAVADRHDDALAGNASVVLPVLGDVREEFSPLLYHVFAGYLAAYLAESLGRHPFRSSRQAEIVNGW